MHNASKTEIRRLEKDHSADELTELLDEFDPIDVPGRYQSALLAQNVWSLLLVIRSDRRLFEAVSARC